MRKGEGEGGGHQLEGGGEERRGDQHRINILYQSQAFVMA